MTEGGVAVEGDGAANLDALIGGDGWVTLGERRLKMVFVTADIAQQILHHRNPQNRNPSDRNIERFSRDMIAGKWRSNNGESIKFKGDDELADGQNRLFAVIRAAHDSENPEAFGVPLLVTRDVTDEDMTTIDTGRSRTFGDVMRLNGEVNTYQLAAAIQAYFYMLYPDREQRIEARPTHEQLKEFFHSCEDIREHVHEGQRIAAATQLNRSVLCAVAYEVRRKHEVEFGPWIDFREKLVTGFDIGAGDPAGALRNFGLQGTARIKSAGGNSREFRRHSLIGTIKAWNATMLGREVRRVKVLDNDGIPDVA